MGEEDAFGEEVHLKQDKLCHAALKDREDIFRKKVEEQSKKTWQICKKYFKPDKKDKVDKARFIQCENEHTICHNAYDICRSDDKHCKNACHGIAMCPPGMHAKS